jgi:allantoicase
MREHWKRVVGYEYLYAVSTFGQVFSFRANRVLKPWWKHRSKSPSHQYLAVELWVNGKVKQVYIHTIVLTAFRGPRPPSGQSRHLDGDRANNRLDNLKWGTYLENRADKIKHGKAHKLTVEQINRIRTSSKSLRAMAAEIGCSKSNVWFIRRYSTWADI